MRQRILRAIGRGSLAVLGAAVVLGVFSLPAAAQDDGAPPPDPEQIAGALETYMNEFSNADLDGDGIADFADIDGDGVPDIPQGEPGDLDLRPGDGRFGEEVTAAFLAELGIPEGIDTDDGSLLLYDCSGMAISYDSNGQMVDWAIGIGSAEGGGPNGQLVDLYPPGEGFERAFTKSNPFVVVDTVIYFGRMPGEGDGAKNHTWYIKTAGISLDSGGDDNPDLDNRNAGEVSIGDDVPGGSFLMPSGIFPVEGDLDSENGVKCYGKGWVEFDTGNPVLSAAGLTAALVGLGGIAGLLFNARPAVTWKA